MRGDLVNLNFRAFNIKRSGLIAKYLGIPHYAYYQRCVQVKIRNHILTDYKKEINKE